MGPKLNIEQRQLTDRALYRFHLKHSRDRLAQGDDPDQVVSDFLRFTTPLEERSRQDQKDGLE